uniref:F-box protein 40 n=1 Tax=Sinocyclocheilus rhinocerous TaxID=307959 RepID=A0A673GBY4_9TELE
HNQHCKIPVDIPTSCFFISCHLQCGAAFHLCKEDEHRLLCPKEIVPCLNAGYGCPMTMTRQRLAQHLELCPASVITCTLEWNRWPVNEIDTMFYRNALQDTTCMSQLDLAMDLRDQKLLFSSIQMKTLFPELIEKMDEPEVPLDGAVGGVDPERWESQNLNPEEMLENSLIGEEVQELTQEERLALAKSKDVACLENVSVTYGNPRSLKKGTETSTGSTIWTLWSGFSKPTRSRGLSVLRKEVNMAEYNMYLVHNGCMLINFGQLAACTPKDKDFVYGNLEPIEVQTIHSSNAPISYRAKRSHLKDPSQMVKTDQNVDTSDLGIVIEELPKANEVEAICVTVGTDGLYVDFGTQTYDFHSAPFKSDASLADVVAEQPQNLHVQIQTECVTRRHNKSCSAFTYLCCHAFRHIQSCLTGWFLQRCPLAYLGCTFSQKKFRPSKYQATVSYDTDLSTFILQAKVAASLYKGVKTISSECKRARNLDSLSRLPFEILHHIVSFLDSVSLGRLSRVSQLMREVCSTVLQQKGTVSLKWEKNTYSHEHLNVCPFYQKEIRSEPVALPSMTDLQERRGEFQTLVNIYIYFVCGTQNKIF